MQKFDDDRSEGSGSAYLYNMTTGEQLFKLNASDASAGDQFGNAVAISGNTAVVGAPLDDDRGERSGSAYLFDIDTGTQRSKLLANGGTQDDQFGRTVAISGNTVIVGALPGRDDDG